MATFHISDHVHKHMGIWVREQLRAFCEHTCDSPKVNVRYGLALDKVIGAVWFTETIVTLTTCRYVLEVFVVPQI